MRLLIAPALSLLLAASGAVPGTPWPDGNPSAASGGIRLLGPMPPGHPRRVVSLAPSMTDIVIALDKADRLVGVSKFDDAPEVRKVPRVGGFLDPSVEAVVALRPDLALWLTDGGALPAVSKIAELGIPVLAIPVIGIDDVLRSCRAVGRALGDAAAGERLAAGLEASLARTRARVAALPARRVLLIVGREPLVVAGPGSYPDALLSIAGGANVAEGTRPWPVYPLEKAVAANPDLVLDAAVNEPAEGMARLAAIPAVRAGRVARLPNDDALRPGPRLVRALDDLLRAMHPEARLP